MSEKTLIRLKDQYERWAAGDWTDSSSSIFDDYAVGVFPDPTPQAQYGRGALATYMRSFLESWDGMRMEGTEFREVGDSFVVRVRLVALGRQSGVKIDNELFHLWTFRGPRAVRMEVFFQEREALEAVGLSE
jgi:ketosteroid isomerase-like protein